jgi:acetyl esterase/lipase
MHTYSVSTHLYKKPQASPRQALDLYLPNTILKDGLPLLIFIHGGAWISQSKENFSNVGKAFARRGIACTVIDYRLTEEPGQPPTGIKHPDHVEDCAAGINWLRANSNRFGLDSKNIFIMGHSAGAFMAAELGLNEKYLKNPDEIAGFICTEGIYNLSALAATPQNPPEWFIIPVFGASRVNWDEASPQYGMITNRKSPWLLIHSEADELVSLAQTVQFAKRLGEDKVSVEAKTLSDKKHDEVINDIGVRTPSILEMVEKWVRASLRI